MGLDMYLEARYYCGRHLQTEHTDAVEALNIAWPVAEGRQVDYYEIVCCVAYWRKANAIHKWFVDNCQDGVDDCRSAYVDYDEIIQLHSLCVDLLERGDINHARNELPPQDGFFFGDTENEEWYWQDLKDTVKMLEPIVKKREEPDWHHFDFRYRSSW